MPIDLSGSTLIPGTNTFVGTLNANTWTLVTLPAKARWCEVINNTGGVVHVRRVAVADTTAYAAGNPQNTIANGGSEVIELTDGRALAEDTTLSIHAATAVQIELSVGGSSNG